jgi:hypothetical protein
MGARHFGVGEETTWGEAKAPTRFFEALSESVQTERNFESVETLRGFSPTALVQLTALVRGDVEVLASYEELGLLYQYMFGGPPDTNASGAGYAHVFPDPATGIPDTDRIGEGLTLEFRRDGSLSWRYAGAKITSMSHTFGTDQSSRINFSFMAKQEALAGPATTSFFDLAPMFPKHVNAYMGATTVPCRSITLDMENPLDETFLLGSDGLAREPDRNGVFRITGSIEALFDNTDIYTNFDGETYTNVTIEAISTATNQLIYSLPKVMITQATPHMNARDRLAVTYEFEAVYYNDSQEAFSVTLVNSQSTP